MHNAFFIGNLPHRAFKNSPHIKQNWFAEYLQRRSVISHIFKYHENSQVWTETNEYIYTMNFYKQNKTIWIKNNQNHSQLRFVLIVSNADKCYICQKISFLLLCFYSFVRLVVFRLDIRFVCAIPIGCASIVYTNTCGTDRSINNGTCNTITKSNIGHSVITHICS